MVYLPGRADHHIFVLHEHGAETPGGCCERKRPSVVPDSLDPDRYREVIGVEGPIDH